MPRIFISYRRADTSTMAGRIHDHLVQAFGEKNVFKDVDDIPPGTDFRAVLHDEISACDVQLVIIGPDWAGGDADGNARLHDPEDFVRLEIEAGLQRQEVLVVPVLVEGAAMPAADTLPPTLAELAYRNAVIVRHDPDFRRDVNRLIDTMRAYEQSQRRAGGMLTRLTFALVVLALVSVGLVSLAGGLPTADTSPTPQATLTQADNPQTSMQTFIPITTLPDVQAAAVALAAGDAAEAVRLYTLALRDDPDEAALRLARAEAYAAAGAYDEAVADAQRVVDSDQASAEAYLALGTYQRARGMTDEARRAYERAIDLLPDDAVQPYIALGDLYRATYSPGQAIDAYQTALDRLGDTEDARTVEAYVGLALAYQDIGGGIEAYDFIDFALAIDPAHPQANAIRGDHFVSIGDHAEALTYYTRAIESEPQNPAWYLARAEAHRRLGDAEAATADYDRAVALEPTGYDGHSVYLSRGSFNLEQGRYEAAIDDFAQADQLDPQHGKSRLYSAWGDALAALDQTDEALERYQQAIETSPDFAIQGYAGRAALRLRQGNYAAALSDITTALAKRSGDADLHQLAAIIYVALDDMDAAQRQYGRYLDAGGTPEAFEQAIASYGFTWTGTL